MKSKKELTQAELHSLLSWLDDDPEQAGKKYELIRCGLIRMFICRGCPEAEDLTDETINRVARKAETIGGNYVGDPAHYFFGVAKKVYLEYQRKTSLFVPLPPQLPDLSTPAQPDELKFKCLESCMKRFTPSEREIVWHYYQVGVGARQREALARRMGLRSCLKIHKGLSRRSIKRVMAM
jgi:hypothetical protein